MNERLKVKDDLTLERDLATNAIINTDVGAYESMMQRRRLFLEKDEKIKTLQCDISALKIAHHQMQEQIQKLIAINTVNNL